MGADKGVLYVATGRRCLREAASAVASLRAVMPSAHVTLWTDDPDFVSGAFDEIRRIDGARHAISDRFRPIIETPYERTLYLDTDTHVCADLAPVFTLLDRFDLAVSHAPTLSQSSGGRAEYRVSCPECFPELNPGVLLYRKATAVQDFLGRWAEVFEGHRRDNPHIENVPTQPAFREALYRSDVRFYVLPPQFNLRTPFPCFLPGGSRPQVIHGRHPDMGRVAQWLGQSHSKRVFLPSLRHLGPKHFGILTPSGQVLVRVLGWLFGRKR